MWDYLFEQIIPNNFHCESNSCRLSPFNIIYMIIYFVDANLEVHLFTFLDWLTQPTWQYQVFISHSDSTFELAPNHLWIHQVAINTILQALDFSFM